MVAQAHPLSVPALKFLRLVSDQKNQASLATGLIPKEVWDDSN